MIVILNIGINIFQHFIDVNTYDKLNFNVYLYSLIEMNEYHDTFVIFCIYFSIMFA